MTLQRSRTASSPAGVDVSGYVCPGPSTPELIELGLVKGMGPKLRQLPVSEVVDVDHPSVKAFPPRPPGGDAHQQYRVFLTYQRVVDRVLDGSFGQLDLELIQGFKSATAFIVAGDAASARNMGYEIVGVQGPVPVVVPQSRPPWRV
jgi:hypothetical protein